MLPEVTPDYPPPPGSTALVGLGLPWMSDNSESVSVRIAPASLSAVTTGGAGS